MPDMAPQAGVNGVLPVAVFQKNAPSQAPRGPKAAAPRLKLICRRLPPGMTHAEFEAILGDEWKAGAGKVDWMRWEQGKISKDAAKPSKPGRAYMHVLKQEYATALGDKVRESTFHDAAKSWQDSALVGPPTLELAPYPKMPGGRRRNDNRQGTIDQDPEFKDFLESLTNPITKPAAPDDSQKLDKVRTTPLIEALREKKANRDKPNSKANRTARGDGKDDAADKKIAGKAGKENAPVAGDKNRRAGKADKTQAARDAVKILNKEASSSKDSAAAGDKTTTTSAPERKRGNVAGVKSLLQRDLGIAAAPTRRRGTKREVASAASDATLPKDTTTPAQKRKDIPTDTAAGTSDKPSPPTKKERPTRAERRAFKASATDKPADKPDATKTQTPAKTATVPAPQILKKPQPAQAAAPPKGPAASRPTPTEPAAARATPPPPRQTTPAKPTPPVAPVQRSTPPPPVPAPTSKQGFLKHANPSQGITEPLIEETLKAFGAIERVEIDKRKGFAYVDFVEPEGLRKAMAASPIKIAQGAVQVLERKEKAARPVNPRFNGPPPTGPARGGRGGFAPRGRGALRGGAGGARGAHMVASPAGSAPGSPAPTPAAPASVSPAPTPVASVDVAT